MTALAQGLALAERAGDRFSRYIALYNRSMFEQATGDHDRAAASFREGLAFSAEVGDHANVAYCLEGLTAVDLGAGEGRDAVFLAENGLEVLAVDVSPDGFEKALRLAKERGVDLRVQQGDVNFLELEGSFDLVYSIGTIQYLSPENREERFGHFKGRTAPGSLHALFAFVAHPDLPPAPDRMEDECLYAPGERPIYYAGWEVLHSRAFVFDDFSGGVHHQHAAEEYVFGNPS